MGEAADGIGTIFTGGIVAREVEHGGGPGAAHGDHGGTCLNCGTALEGDFCHACGQSAHVHRTVASIGHDILHGVFHFEGKFWSTLPMLILHPGALTRRYIDGERAKFVSPMALFLFSVFLLFAAVNRVAMPDVAGLKQGMAQAQSQFDDGAEKLHDKLDGLREKRADRLSDDAKAPVADLDAQIKKTRADLAVITTLAAQVKGLTPAQQAETWNRFADTQSGQWRRIGDDLAAKAGKSGTPKVINTGSESLDRQIRFVRDNPELYAYKLKMASYKFSWALIPISVPLIWLLFLWRPQYGAYDHAIFAIYSLSFMTLLAVGLIGLYLIGVPSAPLWLTMIFAPPFHMYKQLKGTYRLRRFSAAWRTGALLVMTSIAGSLFFALLLWLEAE